MRWLRPAAVWKRVPSRFVFFFVGLSLWESLFRLLWPPHRVRWEAEHYLSLSFLGTALSELFRWTDRAAKSRRRPFGRPWP